MSVPIFAGTLRWLAEGLARSWQVEIVGEPHLAGLRAAGIPVIFAVWHGALLAPLWHRRRQGIALLVSAHRDAEALAHAGARWGYEVVRGSSTRGGIGGLRAVVRTLRRGGDAAFAPDGPRGPAGRVKPGVLGAARLGGAALIPVGVHAAAAWELGSWDAMRIPRPGAHVRIVYGPPLFPMPGSGDRCGDVLTAAIEAATQAARC